MKKVFKKQTMLIENGAMLEEVKAIFEKQGFTTLWGYDSTYELDKEVSRGYLHYEDKVYFLSKESFAKEILSYDYFKWSLEHMVEEQKTYTLDDLKKAMEYGYDYGYQQGITDALSDEVNGEQTERESFEKQMIFEEWLAENN